MAVRDRQGRFHRHVWKYETSLLRACHQRTTEIGVRCYGCGDTQTASVPGQFKCEVEIADLQRQLREAQKEQGREEKKGKAAWILFERRCAELSAAIKRGNQVCQIARFYKRRAEAAEAGLKACRTLIKYYKDQESKRADDPAFQCPERTNP